MARSGQVRRGLVTWRRSIATSWRRMRISTFLAAALRVSRPSQPNSLTVVRFSSRNNTTGDHVMITEAAKTAGHTCGDFGTAQADELAYKRILLVIRWTLPCQTIVAAPLGGMSPGRLLSSRHNRRAG